MNPHEVERTISGIFCGVLFILGGLIGYFSFWNQYKLNPNDCTVKCPDMAHSIQYNQKCYCEVK